MKNKAQFQISAGFITRFIGGVIEVLALPFIITNPTNVVALIFGIIGGGLVTVGGVMN